MCFTPTISLTTAIFEFIIGTYILLNYKKSPINKWSVVFIYLLGLYQFSEFMLCTSQQQIWAKLAFISYIFVPAVGLIFCLKHIKKKDYAWLLIFPALFSIVSLKEDFITKSVCETYFVITQNILTPTLIVHVYYTLFVASCIYILMQNYAKQKKAEKKTNTVLALGIIISLVPAFILITVLPGMLIKFPSIYCQFAVVFTFITLYVYHLNDRKRKK